MVKNMSLVLDTYALIELFEGSEKGKKVKELIEKDEDVFISVLTIYELGTYLEREIGKEKADPYLRSISTHFNMIDIDEHVSFMAIDLKPKTSLPAIDCLIYASARSVNAKVISGCKHFKKIDHNMDVIIV